MFCALAWARGELSDADLLRESGEAGGPAAPALLIAALSGVSGVRGLLRELRWYDKAYTWVFRTKTPQVIAWVHRYGAVKTFVETSGAARYIARDGACRLFLSRGRRRGEVTTNSTRGASGPTRSNYQAGSGMPGPAPENPERMA